MTDKNQKPGETKAALAFPEWATRAAADIADQKSEPGCEAMTRVVETVCKEAPVVYRNEVANRLQDDDSAAHRWYRFVLSFPPHLVRDYLEDFGIENGKIVLDPFCGTGTTIVECQKMGISSIGIEALPMAHFASQVKTDWSPMPRRLLDHAKKIAEKTIAKLEASGIQDIPFFAEQPDETEKLRRLPEDIGTLLLKGSVSPLPMHKTLVLMETIEENRDKRYYEHERLALANALVDDISNLRFGPEIGVGKKKEDAPVVAPWLSRIQAIAEDLEHLPEVNGASTMVHRGDARDVIELLKPNSIDAVFTSPPYPNEKDYTRTTRLETVLLGFVKDKVDLRALKKSLVRSNTRSVYKADDDDAWIENHAEIQRIAGEIEERRIELGKTSGFERLYHRVTKLYFGGMARHLAVLRKALRPGAQLAYVVGDQASYLRVMIRTGQLLADIAESLGYEVDDIDLFRTRLATATKEQLREEVVRLRWPGK
ncbi:DNA methyltransferase [Candidatus Thiosymbion oneisti]|uniref:DNA methyltransferase n=1 Tax=Candidatus Thiosymbion oneisti TaxID=589554 RepID=UPI001A9C6DCF|nr:DNA methyltransferase [Candidatus Thiosymbion oneisti]